VAEKVLHRHLAVGRDGVEDRLAGHRVGLLHADLPIAERGEMLRHRVRDEEPAFFVEHHRGDGRERLGHGGDAEDRVGGHRRASGLVTEADRLGIGDAALPGDHDDRAGDASALDVGPQRLADAVEPRRREADFLGLRAR
jgi:hypothetical protein